MHIFCSVKASNYQVPVPSQPADPGASAAVPAPQGAQLGLGTVALPAGDQDPAGQRAHLPPPWPALQAASGGGESGRPEDVAWARRAPGEAHRAGGTRSDRLPRGPPRAPVHGAAEVVASL